MKYFERTEGRAAGKVPKKFVTDPRVEAFVDKYMKMLDLRPNERPKIIVSRKVASGSLGTTMWFASHPTENFIEIVDYVVNGDPRALESVVAHEMAHVACNVAHIRAAGRSGIDPSTGRASDALRRSIVLSPPHGRDFLEYAEKINAIEGERFVTVESDVVTKGLGGTSKPYYLMLIKGDNPRLENRVWVAWAAILPKVKTQLRRAVREDEAALIRTTDPFYTSFTGKMDSKGVLVPSTTRDPAVQARLEKDYLDARRYNAAHPEELEAMLAEVSVKPYYVMILADRDRDGNLDLSYAWSDEHPRRSALTAGTFARREVYVVKTTDPRFRMERRAKIGSAIVLRTIRPKSSDRPYLVKLLAEHDGTHDRE